MVSALKKVVEKAGKLPAKEQNAIAELINDELGWEESLEKSKNQLSKLAEEALEEYKKGNAKPLEL